MKNPYRWDLDAPDHTVPRAKLLQQVVAHLSSGSSGYILGCRGMGKSTFLSQLRLELSKRSEIQIVAFPDAGTDPSPARWVQAIAEELIRGFRERGDLTVELERSLQEATAKEDLRALFGTYDRADVNSQILLLIYDELDGYAPKGKFFFNALESARKSSQGRIAVLGAGGLGVAALDSVYGSSFFSRMESWILEPFDRDQVRALAEPFAREGRALSDEVLEALLMTSGGHVGLATFAMQGLWDASEPNPRSLEQIFWRFRAKHQIFLAAIRDPVLNSPLSDAPAKLWNLLRNASGPVKRSSLQAVLDQSRRKLEDGIPTITLEWVLRMLRSSGLVRGLDGDHLKTELSVEILPSILTLDLTDTGSTAASIRERLVSDLTAALAVIHRYSPDFFGEGERVAPEAVFAVVLSISLHSQGWHTDRETISGAGRTDIKGTHDAFPGESVLIEIKHWDRNDYTEIHQQVVDYCSSEVSALATVMITCKQAGWPVDYEEKCLRDKVTQYQQQHVRFGVEAHFVASSDLLNGPREVDHFLLKLARRVAPIRPAAATANAPRRPRSRK